VKVLLDTLEMDRPKNSELKNSGRNRTSIKACRTCSKNFRNELLTAENQTHGVTVGHCIISFGLKILLDGNRLQP